MSSKRFRAAAELIDPAKRYALKEAIALIKQTATTKFDSAVEAHFRLGVDPTKADQAVRGTVELPHGRGRQLRVAVFAKGPAAAAAKKAGADQVGDDDLIQDIKRSEKTTFDVALAAPDMMKSLAPIAKILGTRGLMPNPKDGTITAEPANIVGSWREKRVVFRSDDTGNLHAVVGRASFSPDQLIENFTALLEAVKKARPAETKGTYLKSITLTSTMGPAVRLETAG